MFHPYSYAGPVRIPPPQMQLRVRRETNAEDTINARQFETWQTSAPVVQGGTIDDIPTDMKPVFYDMAPLSSRTDKQDYRQSQPFIATGPSLAMNPYFDRYDPTRDPRNMIREVRSVVYEEKQADRGLAESKRLSERGYISRWMPEGSSDDLKASLQAYEIMRPKVDEIANTYNVSTTTFNDTYISSLATAFNQT
ncbi:hypothetical protein EBV26_16615 [bacterium]|nr:hypothetical protein [bacterium]